MSPSSRTPEGQPNCCPVCGNRISIEPSSSTQDAPCPVCGSLLWFINVAGGSGAFGFHSFFFSDHSIRSKAEALGATVDGLVAKGALPPERREGVLAAIWQREERGSTGIGQGVALPHAMHPGVDDTVGAIAKFAPAIEFDSLDREPVHLVCLLVSPQDRPGEHLRLLESISRHFR